MIVWEAFSLFYYGSAVPNTAHAKLTTALSAGFLAQRGLDYVLRTLLFDPVTLPVCASAIVATIAGRRSDRPKRPLDAEADWPLALGIVLYVAYVVRIGGDFMMGRFFVAPFVVAAAVLGRSDWLKATRPAFVASAVIVVVGLAAPWEPALLSGYGYSRVTNWVRGRHTLEPADQYRYMFVRWAVDERRLFSEFTSVLRVGFRGLPSHEWIQEGLALRAQGRSVVIRRFIGMLGYTAGPQVHIVDEHALSDPLLARLPGGSVTSIIGHLARRLPDGYVETVESGRNQIVDRELAAYYDALHEVVSAPLWSPHRLQTLVMFLMGRYDGYLNAYLERHRNDPAPEIH